MEKNIFDTLFSYRPRPNRIPLEDFFTELLGFFFDFDKGFTSEWIQEIWNKKIRPNPDGIRVLTQYSLGDYGRADLALFWADENDIRKSLLLENKIGAEVGERGANESGEIITQVHNYLHYQSERGNPEDHKVAIMKVTALPSYPYSSPYFLGEFAWGTLYKFIKNKNKLANDVTTRFFYNQIAEFMRRKNMVFDNFTIQELGALGPYSEFRLKRNQLTDIIHAKFKVATESIKGILNYSYQAWGAQAVYKYRGLILHNKETCAASNIWIHIGLSMNLAEERPVPSTTLRSQGIPDVQVMLGLWFNPKDTEKINEKYKSVIGELNESLKTDSKTETNFELISKEGSLFFCFRKPLTDFLKYDDQESEIIKFLETGLKAISHLAKQGILSRIVNDDCLK